jgi:hypothetical protein
VYDNSKNEDGTLLYGRFYHIVGKIHKGEDCWKRQGSQLAGVMISVTKDFQFGFTWPD